MQGESVAHAIFRFENGVTAMFDAFLTDTRVGPCEDFRITGTVGEILIERGRKLRVQDKRGVNDLSGLIDKPGVVRDGSFMRDNIAFEIAQVGEASSNQLTVFKAELLFAFVDLSEFLG